MKNIIVSSDLTETRLDKYLVEKMPELSRNLIQTLIKQGHIKLNNKIVTPHQKIVENDNIEIIKTEPDITKAKVITKVQDIPKVPIVEETDEFIIINKPAGLTVHGGDAVVGMTLVDFLLNKFPYLRKIGEDPERPAIVHRLDNEVSGLMVIPKNQDSFDNIKEQFQKRTMNKQYSALVYGEILKNEGEIRFPIKRSKKGYKMAALPETTKGKKQKEGKIAISEYYIDKKFINYTLVNVKIKTGRTHQVRCHLSAFGYPIVGDDLYGTKKTREKNAKLKLGRIFLIANQLEFTDLKGEKHSYTLNYPTVLANLLKKIK